MAREIEILSLKPDGHVLVTVVDEDATSLEFSTTIPARLLTGTTAEMAENVKDYLQAHWPVEALNLQRENVRSGDILTAIGSKFDTVGTPREAQARLDARVPPTS